VAQPAAHRDQHRAFGFAPNGAVVALGGGVREGLLDGVRHQVSRVFGALGGRAGIVVGGRAEVVGHVRLH
jgi:hypothetical protein